CRNGRGQHRGAAERGGAVRAVPADGRAADESAAVHREGEGGCARGRAGGRQRGNRRDGIIGRGDGEGGIAGSAAAGRGIEDRDDRTARCGTVGRGDGGGQLPGAAQRRGAVRTVPAYRRAADESGAVHREGEGCG